MITFTSKVMCTVHIDSRFETPQVLRGMFQITSRSTRVTPEVGLAGSVFSRVLAAPLDVVCTQNALALSGSSEV